MKVGEQKRIQRKGYQMVITKTTPTNYDVEGRGHWSGSNDIGSAKTYNGAVKVATDYANKNF